MNEKYLNQKKAIRFRRFSGKSYSAFNSMHKVVNIAVVAGIVLTSMIVPTMKAQDTTAVHQLQSLEKELEEVTVTASRIEIPIGQTAQQVTIITKEQIDQAPVQSIQDLLVYISTIDVVERGGHGVQADISIRGGSFDQNAILLNGVNLSNPQTGHYSLDIPINISDIERIEIIHGPSALVYGASALSGGINIITKKIIDNRLYANIELGMHNLKSLETRVADKLGNTINSLSAGYTSSDGYIKNTDYNIYNLLWQTRYRNASGSRLDLQLGYNDKQYGANNFYSPKYPDQYEKTSTYLGSVKAEFGSTLKTVPIIYWTRHHNQFDLVKNTDFGRNFHRNDTYGGNLIFIYKSRLGVTSMGGELRREDIISSVLGKPMANSTGKYKKYDARTNSSIALEHTFNIEKLTVSSGILLNHNSLRSKEYKIYPSVSAAYNFSDVFKIISSWRKSTRMPTFTDLYYTTPTHEGNSNLKPEQSESIDLNLKWDTYLYNIYLSGYFQKGNNMIDWLKMSPQEEKWKSWNITEINTQGIEIGAKLNVGNLFSALGRSSILKIDYAWTNQNSDTKGYISIYKLNYLRNKLNIHFHHQLSQNFNIEWFFRAQKRMGLYEKYDNGEKIGDAPFPAYSTLDLKLNYKYQDFIFSLNINNLYNTQYYDLGNIPQPGFGLIGSLKYAIK